MAPPNDARVRMASRVERGWLLPNRSELTHRFDRATGMVKAEWIDRYDAIVLAERAATPDPDVAAGLLAAAWMERWMERTLRPLVCAPGQRLNMLFDIMLNRTDAFASRQMRWRALWQRRLDRLEAVLAKMSATNR